MVTILIDCLPPDFSGVDVYRLLEPFCPSHVYMAADSCGNYVGFAFALFSEERTARRALIALRDLDLAGRQLHVARMVAPRTPGEVTG